VFLVVLLYGGDELGSKHDVGHEHVERLADEIARIIAEEGHDKVVVAALDNTLVVDSEDGLEVGVHLLDAGTIHLDARLADVIDAQRHREDEAALVAGGYVAHTADHLALAGSLVLGHVVVMHAEVWLRHQHLEILADQLARLIAPHLGHGGVHAGDDAAQVSRDDHGAVGHALYHADVELLRGAQRHLAHREADRKDGSVLVLALQQSALVDDLLHAGAVVRLQVGVVLLAIGARNDLLHLVAQQLWQRVAEERAAATIDALHDASTIHRDDGAARQLRILGRRAR